MRNKRKIVVELVDTGKVNNERLIEYLTNKVKERGLNNECNTFDTNNT